jgi:cbb3-type cytochrome oxidase maturation protein
MGDQLAAVAQTVQLARRTMRIVRQNLWWAAGYNAVCVPLAVRGVAARLAGGSGHGAELPGRSHERPASGRTDRNDGNNLMDILYLLIPLSVVLVFFILGGLWWAIYRGQFEDIEAEGERILKND